MHFFLKKGTHLGSVHVSCYNHISFYTHLPVYSKIFSIPDNAVDLQKLRTLVIGQLLFKVSLKKTVVYPTFVNAFSVWPYIPYIMHYIFLHAQYSEVMSCPDQCT